MNLFIILVIHKKLVLYNLLCAPNKYLRLQKNGQCPITLYNSYQAIFTQHSKAYSTLQLIGVLTWLSLKTISISQSFKLFK